MSTCRNEDIRMIGFIQIEFLLKKIEFFLRGKKFELTMLIESVLTWGLYMVAVGWRIRSAVRGRLHVCIGEGSRPSGPQLPAQEGACSSLLFPQGHAPTC